MLFPSSMIVVVFLLVVGEAAFHERVLGKVGAENYTYYTLFQEGTVLLRLRSLSGDADLYVGHGQPSYELDGHRLRSATCGTEEIEVDADLRRPLVIGVYGHPSHAESHYELQVRVAEQEEEGGGRHSSSKKPNHKDEEESFVLTVLFGILKLLLEVITS